MVKQKDLSIVLDKRFLCKKKKSSGTLCLAGPAMNVLARMVLHMLHYINDEMHGKWQIQGDGPNDDPNQKKIMSANRRLALW